MSNTTDQKMTRRRYLKYVAVAAVGLALIYGLKDLPKLLARTSYKIQIDRKTCRGDRACYGLDPTHFEGTSDLKAKVKGGTINDQGISTGTFYDDKFEDVKTIASNCPYGSIKVTKT